MEIKRDIKVAIIRNDDIDAFGAYAVGKDMILLNIEGCLIASLEEDISFKELVVETLMHEFGHKLEELIGLEFSEERIEKIIESYRSVE